MEIKKKSWVEYLPVFSILIIAATLFYYRIGHRSLWGDEVSSLNNAENFTWYSARPFYYFLLHIWMIFGTSEKWLRLLSAVFAAGSVFLTYRLGLKLLGRRQALIAALLLALSPAFIYHAQQVRMYTLGTFLGLAGTLALCQSLASPSYLSIAVWAFMRLLAFLTTPLNVSGLLVDVFIIFLHFRNNRTILSKYAFALTLSLTVWMPFAFSIVQAIPVFFSGWVALLRKPTLFSLHMVLSGHLWPPGSSPPLELKIIVILLSCFCFSACCLRPFKKQTVWLAAWILIPAFVAFSISRIFASIWIYRYLLFTLPYLLLLLSEGYFKLYSRQRILASVLAFFYLVQAGAGINHYYFGKNGSGHQDWRAVARTIERQARQGDFIIAPFASGYKVVNYYLSKTKISLRHVPPVKSYADGQWIVEPSFFDQYVAKLPKNASRIWLISKKSPIHDKKLIAMFLNALTKRFPHQRHYRYRGVWFVCVSQAKFSKS